MTDTEYRLKYPIGTKIRYEPTGYVNSNAKEDIGLEGVIIDSSELKVTIHLPLSKHQKLSYYSDKRTTWRTEWKNIKPLIRKNQQLLFAFME